MRFWVGGYSEDSGGSAEGIGMLVAGAPDDAAPGGPLGYAGVAARAESPSWVAAHPTLDVLYGALEQRGAVQAFRRTGDATFVPLGGPVPAGAATCHIAVAPDGGALIASCWSDGRVVRMPLDAAGRPGAPVIAAAATDPYAADADAPSAGGPDLDLIEATRALRAAAGDEYAHLLPEAPATPGPADDAGEERPSRAHQARYLPGGLVVTTDMGLDLVRFWRDGAAGLRAVQQVVLPRGSGPRHTVWHPSGHLYVLTELSREVYVLAPDREGRWRMLSGTPISPATLDGDTAAEIALSRDGETVYAGVRGSDTIGVLRVRGSGDALLPTALVDAGVLRPRHHVAVADTLLVAGQSSHEVVSSTIDPRTGIPGRVRHRAAVPSPTCLLPVR